MSNKLWDIWRDEGPTNFTLFPPRKRQHICGDDTGGAAQKRKNSSSEKGMVLQGFSVAALRTNFYVPELGLMLDAGMSAPFSPEHVFVTHGHSDHSANIPHHVFGPKKTHVYIPSKSARDLHAYMASTLVLSQQASSQEHLEEIDAFCKNAFEIHPVTVSADDLLDRAATAFPFLAERFGRAPDLVHFIRDFEKNTGLVAEKFADVVPEQQEQLRQLFCDLALFECCDDDGDDDDNVRDDDGRSDDHHVAVSSSTAGCFDIVSNGTSIRVKAIPCDHKVSCVGYAFSILRKTLRPDLVGKDGRELKRLKDAGIDINAVTVLPWLVFMGDTGRSILHTSHMQREIFPKFPNVMIECTFLLPEDKDQAEKTRHLHWDDLAPIVTAFPHTRFILFHFSQRYKPEQIRVFFHNACVANVVPWV